MKYIIFSDDTTVVFSDMCNHKDIANGRSVYSAGFCSVETYRNQYDDICAKVAAWGESVTLKVTSHEGDDVILSRMFKH